MKPKSLEFCGINSFSERAYIDFASLTEYGIFGIFGDTGSGKSTVLDCISFALYGDVARSKGSLSEIINYRLDKAYANFEFEIYYEGVRRCFRVEREIKRKNAVQAVRVYEYKEGALAALSEGVRESNALLLKIVGLEQRDFEKCIALPQGEFAQFVKSARSERLKLVSRLFNLEKYGEGLVKRTNAKYAALREESNVLKGKIEQYEEVTKAYIKALKEEIARLEGEERALQKALAAGKEEEKRLTALYEKSREIEKLTAQMGVLEQNKARMKELDSAIMRLEKAAAVLARARECEAARQKDAADAETLERAQGQLVAAQSELKGLAGYDARKAEEEIEGLTARYTESKSADFARKEYGECARRLDQIEKEHAKEAGAFEGFSYEDERRAIEARLQEMGDDGDFMGFAETHGKAALLRGEYAVFADELDVLTQKYDEIAPDSTPLIQKYRTLSAGERLDLSDLRKRFEARKGERERLREAQLHLEKRKSRYDIHLNALQALSTEYAKTKEKMQGLLAQFEGKEESGAIEELLKAKRARKKDCETRLNAANESLSKANLALAAATERRSAARAALESAQAHLAEALAAGAFESVAAAQTLLKSYGDAAEAKRRVEEYKEHYAAVRSRLRELSKAQEESVTQDRLQAFTAELQAQEGTLKNATQNLAVARNALQRASAQLEKKQALEEEFAARQEECERYERLKKLLEGNKFMEFIAEEYLQTVALNASKRLLSLTGGRYFLRYESGFFVGDNFDGGNLRTVATLSGGETFLVSLSLAIALSAEICARSLRPNEFFFLDEGFGTLDEKLVDVVMDSLEKLKNENLTVGIISHVEELKHRINRKLSVKKATEKHGSQIITE